jgi:glycosyltransferase involved in cell wall biosynthesis
MPLGPPIWEWFALKIFKLPTIYDLDDAIWLKNTSKENAFVSFLKWHRKVSFILKNSKAVSAGNEFLANYAKGYNKNVHILPTTVDTNYHQSQTKTENKPIVIGWTGTHSTISYLREIFRYIKPLLIAGEVELLIIADRDPLLKNIDYKFCKFNLSTEIADLDQIDIGLMPLTENEWTKGKCGFKLIQYMSMSKASIANPVGVNRDLLGENERGLISNTNSDWEKGLRYLIENPDVRKSQGERGRNFIESNYSKKAIAPKYQSLISIFA